MSSSLSKSLGFESSRTHQLEEDDKPADFRGTFLSGQKLFLEGSDSCAHSGIPRVTDWHSKLDMFHTPLCIFLDHVCRVKPKIA